MKNSIKMIILILLSTALVVGCNSENNTAEVVNNANDTSTIEEADDNVYDGDITYSGDITVYAQAYQPIEPTEENPNPPTALKEVAAAYEELHPNINIDFKTTVEEMII